MKNKKGFTLVEILAVLGVVAVLMLLIYPKVVNMFGAAKKDAFKIEIESIKKEAEKKYMADGLTGATGRVYCDESLSSLGCTSLDLLKTDKKYKIELNERGKVSHLTVSDGSLCYIKDVDTTKEFDINTSDIKNGAVECTGESCSCVVIEGKKKVSVTVNNGKSDMPYALVDKGTDALFVITPNVGYTLEDATVEGECTLEDNILKASNVTSNKACTITLPVASYKVDLVCTNCTPATSTRTVMAGSNVYFNISANTGYNLNNATVSDGCTLENGKVSVTNVLADTTCRVSLGVQSYKIKLTCTNCTPASEEKNVEAFTNTSFTIAANTGYTLTGATVTGGCTLSGSTVSLNNVTAATTCAVTAPKQQFTVSATCTGCTLNTSSQTVDYNTNATFTLTASSGYSLEGATVTGGCTLSGSTLTASNVTSNKTCAVTAKSSSCTVYCSSSSNCTTTKPTSGFYGSFTCTGGKTGSIVNCFYGSTQCNGGSYGSSNPNRMCTSTTRRNIRSYCNTSLSSTSVAGINVSSSGYNCSCN